MIRPGLFDVADVRVDMSQTEIIADPQLADLTLAPQLQLAHGEQFTEG
jgi:hypothetical protein